MAASGGTWAKGGGRGGVFASKAEKASAGLSSSGFREFVANGGRKVFVGAANKTPLQRGVEAQAANASLKRRREINSARSTASNPGRSADQRIAAMRRLRELEG